MKQSEETKKLLADFGKSLALLFNRAFMYNPTHPILISAIESAYQSLERLLKVTSPVVFILIRDQFFVDEEPLDAKINVARMVFHFQKAKIKSISFYSGVKKQQFRSFFEIVMSMNQYPTLDSMTKALFRKGIHSIKINHIFFKKVSVDEEVLAEGKAQAGELSEADQSRIKQMILESVFNDVLMGKFMEGLNLKNILEKPGQISDYMVFSDLSTAKKHEQKGQRPGHLLYHQLEAIDQKVIENLRENKELHLPDLAKAVCDMRQKLIEGIESQKKKGIVYVNEGQVIDKTNEITDNVLLELVKEEYKSGDFSVPRMAQILCRIIPEPEELKRLLPRIKDTLLEQGMVPDDFVTLVHELESALKSDSLAAILTETAGQIGVDGNQLIESIKENPLKSAEIIYLVSEIKKGGGDEEQLTKLLIDYIEKVGSSASKDDSGEAADNGGKSIRNAMTEAKSDLVRQLYDMDIKKDLLDRLHLKLNDRMEEVLDNIKEELARVHAERTTTTFQNTHTVLETLEESLLKDDKLVQVLKIVREKVDAGKIDENDFNQIYAEIARQDKARAQIEDEQLIPAGILSGDHLMVPITKEISRAERYGTSYSALGFSLVHAEKPNNLKDKTVRTREVIDALLLKLAKIFRKIDIVGEFRNNHIIVLLPMASHENAYASLYRATTMLQVEPLMVDGIPIKIKVAGVATDPDFTPFNAEQLVDQLANQISDMATRLENIHGYTLTSKF